MLDQLLFPVEETPGLDCKTVREINADKTFTLNVKVIISKETVLFYSMEAL